MPFPILTRVNAVEVSPNARARDITHIIIHHSATLSGSAAAYDRYHREDRGWRAIGYHFVVGNGVNGVSIDGAIELGRDLDQDFDVLEENGAHVLGFNKHTIGICGTGHYDETEPDPKKPQIKSIALLVCHLMRLLDIPVHRVLGHREAGTVDNVPKVLKTCPGANVDCNLMREHFHWVNTKQFVIYSDWYKALIQGVQKTHPNLSFYGGEE